MERNSAYDERELLRQIAEGSEDAFSTLFHRYRGKLYHYVLTFSESREAAEDAVHDVFLKLWTNRAKLPAIENLSSYIFRMSRNQVYDGMRQLAKETLMLAELRQAGAVSSAREVDSASQKEIREFILAAIDKLTPQQRKVFILSREKGLRHEQIAQELSISLNTVRVHIGAALKLLREEIGRTYGPLAIAIWVIHELS